MKTPYHILGGEIGCFLSLSLAENGSTAPSQREPFGAPLRMTKMQFDMRLSALDIFFLRQK